jgi:putative ABC transport system substrate-binding protein
VTSIRHYTLVAIMAVSALLFALCFCVEAQGPTKIPRIGYLTGASPSGVSSRLEAFRLGLRELGYIEGQNILIEYRYAEGNPERLPTLAADLVHLNVDVIVSTGAAATRPAKEATSILPIVMAQDRDPVGNGFVASLSRPGGNITGLSTLAPQVSGKLLQLLREVIPRLSRVAVIGSFASPANAEALKQVKFSADALRVQVHYFDIEDPKEIENAFDDARKAHANAILVLGGAVFASQRSHVANLAAKTRLPTMYFSRAFVDRGGLMTYGATITDLDRRAASYVDKILKGAKPADLPVEQPTKFELVINLKAAKQIGLTIPPNVLARADRVIK